MKEDEAQKFKAAASMGLYWIVETSSRNYRQPQSFNVAYAVTGHDHFTWSRGLKLRRVDDQEFRRGCDRRSPTCGHTSHLRRAIDLARDAVMYGQRHRKDQRQPKVLGRRLNRGVP